MADVEAAAEQSVLGGEQLLDVARADCIAKQSEVISGLAYRRLVGRTDVVCPIKAGVIDLDRMESLEHAIASRLIVDVVLECTHVCCKLREDAS